MLKLHVRFYHTLKELFNHLPSLETYIIFLSFPHFVTTFYHLSILLPPLKLPHYSCPQIFLPNVCTITGLLQGPGPTAVQPLTDTSYLAHKESPVTITLVVVVLMVESQKDLISVQFSTTLSLTSQFMIMPQATSLSSPSQVILNFSELTAEEDMSAGPRLGSI